MRRPSASPARERTSRIRTSRASTGSRTSCRPWCEPMTQARFARPFSIALILFAAAPLSWEAAAGENGASGEKPAARPAPPLSVPPDFVVERVAGPPLIERPMMAGFDERGRLFVCDSSGFNLMEGTSEVFIKNPPNAIRLLEDTDGDGR